MPLKVEVDIAEPRLMADRLALHADGKDWDKAATLEARSLNVQNGVYIDPVTSTAFLAPYPTLPGWEKNFENAYARLKKADFDFYIQTHPNAFQSITGSDVAYWVEVEKRAISDTYLLNVGVTGLAKTKHSYPKNQPFYIQVQFSGVPSQADVILFECGWGEPGASDTISLRMWGGGEMSVYRGGKCLKYYDNDTKDAKRQGAGKSLAGNTITLMLLPCRVRELLVVTGSGSGFSHSFEHLDIGLPYNLPTPGIEHTITPPGKFWWNVPPTQFGGTGGQVAVQVAPIRFATTGTLYGPVRTLHYAPKAGAVPEFIPAFNAVGLDTANNTFTCSLANPDGTPFVPDGIKRECRIKVNFGGDGLSSVGLYAVDAVFPHETTTTVAAPVDVTPYVTALTLTVPERGAASVNLTTKRTARAENGTPLPVLDDVLPQADVMGDRTFRVAVSELMGIATGPETDLIRGTLNKPAKHYGGPTHVCDTYEFTGGDRERQLVNYTFWDFLPYDGMTLTEAWERIVCMPGFDPSEVSITYDDMMLPYTPAASRGEWLAVPRRGATAAAMIENLHTTFAATWQVGWRPRLPADGGYCYEAKSPDDLPQVAALEVWVDREAAQDALGPGMEWLAARRVMRSLTLSRVEPEATQILVIGFDDRTKKYILSRWDDLPAQDPTLPPDMRPANWRGEPIRVQVINENLTTQELADRARDVVAARVGGERVFADWTGDLLIHWPTFRPLWRGDVVRLHGRAGMLGDFRIVSLTCKWVKDAKFDGGRIVVRDVSYRAERIAEGA